MLSRLTVGVYYKLELSSIAEGLWYGIKECHLYLCFETAITSIRNELSLETLDLHPILMRNQFKSAYWQCGIISRRRGIVPDALLRCIITETKRKRLGFLTCKRKNCRPDQCILVQF